MSYLSKIGSGLIYYGAFGSIASAIAKRVTDGTLPAILVLACAITIAWYLKKKLQITFG